MKTTKRTKSLFVITMLSGGLLAASAADACWYDRGPNRGPNLNWDRPMAGHGMNRHKDFCLFHRGDRKGMKDMRGPKMGKSPFAGQRLEILKQRLAITPAQAGQWDTFASTMRDIAKERQARFAARREMRKKMRDLPLDQRMAQREAMMQQRMENMHKTSKAISDLYASLDENQRQIINGMRMPMMRP